MKPENVGMVMSIQSLGALLSAILFGRIHKKIGDSTTGFIGAVGYMISFLLFLIGKTPEIFIIGLVCNGIGFAILMAWVNSKAAHNIPKQSAPGIMSIMSVAMYFGQFCSPVIVNTLISLFGIEFIRFPYILGIGLSLIILMFQLYLQEKKKNSESLKIVA